MGNIDIFSIIILVMVFVLFNVLYKIFPRNNDKLYEKIIEK